MHTAAMNNNNVYDFGEFMNVFLLDEIAASCSMHTVSLRLLLSASIGTLSPQHPRLGLPLEW